MSLSRLASAAFVPSPRRTTVMSLSTWSRIQSHTTKLHGIPPYRRPTAHSTCTFSTSTTVRSSESPRSHHVLDVNQTKKIRRKATKAVFSDVSTTSTASTGATAATGSSAPFTSRITPLKRGRDCDRHGRHHDPYYYKRDKHDRRRREDRDNHQHQQHSQQQQAQGRSSRLRYEDFVQPGHHRQHYLYRQRFWHYIRQQQMHNHARDHGHHRGGGGGFNPRDHHQHGPGGFNNPWWSQWNHHWMPWMLQLHLEDAARKAFVVGIMVVCGAYGFYHFKIKKKEEWKRVREDFWRIREKLLDTGEDPPWMEKKKGRESLAWPDSWIGGSGGGGRGTLAAPGTMAFGMGGIGAGGSGPKDLKTGLVSQGLQASEKDLRMLTPEAVEKRLGKNQRSFKIVPPQQDTRRRKEDTGYMVPRSRNVVLGYTLNQVASNYPIEDDMSQHFIRNYNYHGDENEPERYFFGVFDGHSGWCCSQKVAQELAPSISKEINLVRNPWDSQAISEAIERGFLKLDQRIVQDSVKRVLEHSSRPLACSSLLPAISGSCALMAYIDSRENDLYVACVGDSRAVMGVREPTADGRGHVWRAVPLSFDQTGRNPWEVKRLQEEHPGEESTVVRRGRVLGGLEPTRAFGDARYKWTKEIQDKVFSLFPAYREPRPNYNTPPYVTAKPTVRHHKLRPEDRFMIMATDGLWDKLTSDEAVQLVGQLLDGKTGHDEMVLDQEAILAYRRQLKAKRLAAATGSQVAPAQKQQQQEEEDEELTPAGLWPKGPARQVRKFTYRDQANASTHLIRNALGGADDDRLAATLLIPSPQSRQHRDDITVTVVFFGRQDTKMALSDAQDATQGLTPIR
ncbi:protein serine/threonine phosphatase 2C [Linnemannia elongata AG-77]|uniref:Protein serine/threonine phosphatase 2C n=1 Tax=Linnemannia elongata AG-77 TaxID=1314771 RepID=A0A197JHU8_9FUNG|nr:protein serine/threonine phosphatase 2C [Linnemannia elongata AG-77]